MALISGSILVLAVVVFWGVMFLEREIRRQCLKLREQISQVNDRICSVRGDDEIILGQLSETTKIVRELDEQLKRVPEALSRDDEVRLSKSMEEGMANLLQYAAGRAPGVEVRL